VPLGLRLRKREGAWKRKKDTGDLKKARLKKGEGRGLTIIRSGEDLDCTARVKTEHL